MAKGAKEFRVVVDELEKVIRRNDNGEAKAWKTHHKGDVVDFADDMDQAKVHVANGAIVKASRDPARDPNPATVGLRDQTNGGAAGGIAAGASTSGENTAVDPATGQATPGDDSENNEE